MIKAVIFDMDGTLLNTLDDIGICANKALEINNLPRHSLEKYRYYVGEGVYRLFEQAITEDQQTPTVIDGCIETFLQVYDQGWNVKTDLYPGISDMLDMLEARKIRLSVFSNKPEDFVRKCAEYYLSKWRFEYLLGPNNEIPRNPDPNGALLIAEKMGIDRSEVLFIGDTKIDVLTAKAAGMKVVGVLWGFRPKEELEAAGADIIITRPEELEQTLTQMSLN